MPGYKDIKLRFVFSWTALFFNILLEFKANILCLCLSSVRNY